MVSKSTKSIASRIPIDLYFQIQNEADELGLNMKDYLLQIIEKRHEKVVTPSTEINPSLTLEPSVTPPEIPIEPPKVKPPKQVKPKVSKSQPQLFGNELDFSFD